MKRKLTAIAPGASCASSYKLNWKCGWCFMFCLCCLLLQPKPAAAQSTPPEWAWAKQAGGPAADRASSVTTASGDNVYVAGTFSGTAAFGSTSLTSRGVQDVFVTKYDAAGDMLWTRQIGGANPDRATVIAADASGNVYVSGMFSGTADFGGTSLTSSGGEDAFIAKYDASGDMLWVRQIGGAENDGISRLALDASGNLGVAGNLGGNA